MLTWDQHRGRALSGVEQEVGSLWPPKAPRDESCCPHKGLLVSHTGPSPPTDGMSWDRFPELGSSDSGSAPEGCEGEDLGRSAP